MHKRKIRLAVIKVFLCEVSAHLVYWNDIQHALSAFELHKDYLYTFSWHSRPERHARLQNSRLSSFRNVISTAQVRRGKETFTHKPDIVIEVRKPRFLFKKIHLKIYQKLLFISFGKDFQILTATARMLNFSRHQICTFTKCHAWNISRQ